MPLGAYKIGDVKANINKGTATVVVEGAGEFGGKYYGGSKTIKVKINAKSLK